MAPRPALAGPTYESHCLIQACKGCDWREKQGQVELTRCPRCGEALGPPVGLAFGGLSVELFNNHAKLSHGPFQWVNVEPADLADVVRFLVRHAREVWEDRPPTHLARNDTERGFLSLAEDWRTAAKAVGNRRELPYEAQQAALACLLLAHERPSRLGVESLWSLLECYCIRRESRHGFSDNLVWDLCAGCLRRPPASRKDLLPLTWVMQHALPGPRTLAMHMAWILHRRFDPAHLRRTLLDEIACSAGAVEQAIGLLVAVLGSERAFLAEADAFQPANPDLLARYWQRIDEIRARGPKSFQAVYERKELELRRLIEDRCLG